MKYKIGDIVKVVAYDYGFPEIVNKTFTIIGGSNEYRSYLIDTTYLNIGFTTKTCDSKNYNLKEQDLGKRAIYIDDFGIELATKTKCKWCHGDEI